AFRAGNEQNAFVEASPAVVDKIAFRPDVIREHYDLNAGFVSRAKHLTARPACMRSIFCVGVHNRPVLIVSGREGYWLTLRRKPKTVGVNRSQLLNFNAIDARVFSSRSKPRGG